MLCNVGEQTDEEITAYLKDIFMVFGFGTLEDHSNETRFISALLNEFALQNTIGLDRDAGDGLKPEDFVNNGNASAVVDLARA